MPHIFVTHSTADDETVSRIRDALESMTGQHLWVDHRDIKPPDPNFRQTIQKALLDCTAGMLVLSRDSASRPEIDAEWNYILANNRPLLVAKIDNLPLESINYRLTIIQWVDLYKDWNAGIQALAAAIEGKALPENAPMALLRPITGQIDRRLTTIPLSGRDADVAEIKRMLKSGPVAVLGMGGLGKSRMAAEIVLTSEDVNGAIWHTASDISRPDEVIELLREHFNLNAAAEPKEVLARLHTNKRLIVLDNAESIPADDVRRADYVRMVDDLQAAGAQILLTSRVEWDDIQLCQSYTPKMLAGDSAQKIVLDMAKAWAIPHDLTARSREVAEAARLHPRLIEWAMKQMKRFPPEKVIADLRDLKGKAAQDALDEMIVTTLRQMTEAHGAAPEAALRRLNVCRGGFKYRTAVTILTYKPASAEAEPDSVDASPDAVPSPSDQPSVIESETAVPPEGSPIETPSPEIEEEVQLSTDIIDSILAILQSWQFVALNGAHYTIDPLVIAAIGEDATAHRPHYDYYKALVQFHNKKQDYLGLDAESANIEAAFEWAMAEDAEAAYWLYNSCSYFLSNRGRFNQRKDWLERVAKALENHDDTSLKAAVQNSLGSLYQTDPTGNRRDNLKRAIAAYEAALVYRTPQAAPLDYAATQNNIANVYRVLAAVEDREANLKRAIAACEAALVYRTPQAAPLDYAVTQRNLGNTYADLALNEARQANLKRAIAAYEAALIYQTPQAAPLDYASTQNNLGTAYSDLAALETREANLKRAITAYEAALIYHTPQTAPLAYAATQNNLGNAYRNLSRVQSRKDNLQRAVVAYQAALVYRTPEAAPLDYAATQRNLGITYEDLGDLPAAVACWREAEKHYRQMGLTVDADKMQRWVTHSTSPTRKIRAWMRRM